MMIESLLATVGGFFMHQLRRITEKFPNGWEQLTSYVIGVLGVLPFFLLFVRRLKKREYRCFISFVFAFLFAGAGVALGWLVDTMMDSDG